MTTILIPEIRAYVADTPVTLQWRLVGTEVWHDVPGDKSLAVGDIEIRASVQLKQESEE